MWEAGQVIRNRYQLREKFGSNPGRQTWLAQDLESEISELVIVKLLTFGGNIKWDDVRLFEREAQILQELNHDQIPKYKNYFSIDGNTLWFGLVEEYISGDSLKQLLEKGTRFGEVEVIKIAQEVLQILVYLHSFNPPILHRDIKPSNLLMGDDNKIYLVDFGAVQDSFASEGTTFTIVGTYGYTPLEQFGGKTVPASDLYALGITLIHLLTRTAPSNLPTKDLKIQFRDRVTVSPQLVNWLDKMIAPALERRYETAINALKYLSPKNSQELALVKRFHIFIPLLIVSGIMFLIVGGIIFLIKTPLIAIDENSNPYQSPEVEYVPSSNHPAFPSSLKASCNKGPNTLESSSTCPVLKWGKYTYWAYSYRDNRYAMNIVAYDPRGRVVEQWEKPGARYVWAIDVNETAKTVTFKGQANRTIELGLNELLPDKSQNSKPYEPYQSPVVEHVPYSSHPAFPSSLKESCSKGPNTLKPSSTCPVLKLGEYTYWAYSYIDNRFAMNIVAYDSAGRVVQQWEKPGARYVWAIDVNETAKTVTFRGQANRTIEIGFKELLP